MRLHEERRRTQSYAEGARLVTVWHITPIAPPVQGRSRCASSHTGGTCTRTTYKDSTGGKPDLPHSRVQQPCQG